MPCPAATSEMLNGFTTSFGHRLRAMAHAHSLLTQSRWEGADLRSLLEEEVRAHEDHRRHGGPHPAHRAGGDAAAQGRLGAQHGGP